MKDCKLIKRIIALNEKKQVREFSYASTGKKKKIKKKKRVRKIMLAALGVSTCLVGAIVAYNAIITFLVNNADQSAGNFSPDNVFDDNDNGFDFDDNGQIVFDNMTADEKRQLTNKIEDLILQDARYSQQDIDVQQILSIDLLPSNSYSENDSNLYDKYRLSILFSDGEGTYNLNYFTGKEFESNEELSANFVADFITYLSNNFLDSCENMSEAGKSALAAIDGAIYVGNAYVGVADSGDEYYSVPVYFEDGSTKVYYASKTIMDRDNLDPMQELIDELQNAKEQKLFLAYDVERDENLTRFIEIYRSMKSETAQEKGIELN